MQISRKPRNRRFALVGLVALLGLIAAACQVGVSAHTITVVDAQEEAWYSNGDEPYIAVIKWRVIPGTAGSAATEFIGNLQEIDDHMYDGDTAPIPPAMGAVSFDNVQPSSLSALLNDGTVPELVGTVVIGMESDLTSWGTINNMMEDVESALLTELQDEIEPLPIASLLDPQVIGQALSDAAADVEAAVTPSVLDAILIWLGSLGDPDDLIGIGFTVWTPAVGALGQLVEANLDAALPAGAVGGVWWNTQDPKNETLRLSGDGATYDISITATIS